MGGHLHMWSVAELNSSFIPKVNLDDDSVVRGGGSTIGRQFNEEVLAMDRDWET